MKRPYQFAINRTQPRGEVDLRIIRSAPIGRLTFEALGRFGRPQRGLPDEINRWRRENFHRLVAPFAKLQAARLLGILTFYGSLYLKRQRPLVAPRLLGELMGEWLEKAYGRGIQFPDYLRSKGIATQDFNFGLASLKLVTDNGVGFIVDAFQNLVELENMKFHGIGTGTNAEAQANSALQTELTTQYNPDNTRATGSTTENAANIYRTVGTNTVDAPVAITEHGLLSQAAVGGGVLLDRSVFSANNLVSGDSFQSTYDGTFSAGG